MVITLKFILTLFLTIAFLNGYSQSLTFNAILKSYSLDSLTLKKFCTDNKFHLVGIEGDNARTVYDFDSDSSNNISLERTFPIQDSKSVFLYYHFAEKSEYVSLKKAVKSNGFKFQKRVFPFEKFNIEDEREIFQKDSLTIEISTSDKGPKYTLMIYRN